MRDKNYDIKQTIWKLTVKGMLKYGFQLTLVEIFTIIAIYMVKDIIDYLQSREAPFSGYAFFLFSFFTITRALAVFIRNYYDLHVYNYFRFV